MYETIAPAHDLSHQFHAFPIEDASTYLAYCSGLIAHSAAQFHLTSGSPSRLNRAECSVRVRVSGPYLRSTLSSSTTFVQYILGQRSVILSLSLLTLLTEPKCLCVSPSHWESDPLSHRCLLPPTFSAWAFAKRSRQRHLRDISRCQRRAGLLHSSLMAGRQGGCIV
jgi:hypothetical protein